MMHQAIDVEGARAARDATRWCILRTAAPRTLSLAAALAEAGYDVWTPSRMQKRRTLRGKTKLTEVEVPLMPTFVFVRANRLEDLRIALRMPVCPYPAFSIFHFLGKPPRVENSEIERLRTEELRGRPRQGGDRFARRFRSGGTGQLDRCNRRGRSNRGRLHDRLFRRGV